MGPWRSPVAHLHGMQGVRGSNPLGSTKVQSNGHFRIREDDEMAVFLCWSTVWNAQMRLTLVQW